MNRKTYESANTSFCPAVTAEEEQDISAVRNRDRHQDAPRYFILFI